MKKVISALAVSAVAVSMLAFTGCGEKTDEGAIKGNYQEKTPEQLTAIINNIDAEKIFDSNAVNMGVRANFSGTTDTADFSSSSFTVGLDFKVSASESGLGGQGSVSLKSSQTSGGHTVSSEFSGTAYTNTEFVYAASGDDKIKINLVELIDALQPNVEEKPLPSFYAASDAISIADMLAMAQQFGIKITVDDSKGVKFKLSATEETVWKIAEFVMAEGGETSVSIEQLKQLITFNAFKFDLYFALDADGKFNAASIVTNVDVSMPMPENGADVAAPVPTLSVKIKGSLEIFTHNDTVTVPDTVTGDATYVDMTDTVINMIKNMM